MPAPVFPRRLSPGDTVAVISPSWGGPSLFPHVLDLGNRNIERIFEVKVKVFPTSRMTPEELYRNPQLRAADVNAAFADPEVNAIFASIGGDDSVRILPYLDLPTILANPKILMGYSDTTTLTSYLAQHGLVTFNGPSVMAGFSQSLALGEDYEQSLRAMLTEEGVPTPYEPFPGWTNGGTRWEDPAFDGSVLPWTPNEGWRWLQGSSPVQGQLFGGCIEVLEFMKATPFWPSPDFWDGKVLFFETSEDVPTVNQIVWMLRNYGSMGALSQVAGLLFGRARGYADPQKEALYEAIVRVAGFEFDRPDMLIVVNMDFGHTDPQWILPLNVLAEIDPASETFRLLESPVS